MFKYLINKIIEKLRPEIHKNVENLVIERIVNTIRELFNDKSNFEIRYKDYNLNRVLIRDSILTSTTSILKEIVINELFVRDKK